MAKRVTITFPTGRDQYFYSRVLDFGESLYGPIVHTGLGKLCDLDKATPVIWIELSDRHNSGKVKAVVRQHLVRSHLVADATISLA